MNLPNAARAYVDAAKIRDYLLSAAHPVGRFKARVFARAGYSQRDWQRLQQDLQRVALSGDALPGVALPYGQPYEIRAILQVPMAGPSRWSPRGLSGATKTSLDS